MTATSLFVYIATVLFVFLFIIWTSKDWPNVIIKTSFFLMAIFGVVLSLASLGIVTSATVRLF